MRPHTSQRVTGSRETVTGKREDSDLLIGSHHAGQGRVIAIFQPHLFSRTRIFAAEFGAALALADEAIVLDVYAAREDPEPGVTGQLIVDAVPGGHARFVPETARVAALIDAIAEPGDLVLTMNLTEMVDSDAKRLVDFAAGLIFGLRGSIERVTNKVFLLSPANVEVTAEDKARIAERGFFNQS